jgi:hypothetical protein
MVPESSLFFKDLFLSSSNAGAGLLQLQSLKHLRLEVRVTGNSQQTSFCTVPNGLSRLSALTSLSLEIYYDHMESDALLHLTRLVDLYLHNNPTKDRADVGWVHRLPLSLR